MDQVAVLVPSRVCVQPKEVVVVLAQDVFPSRICVQPKEVVEVGAQVVVPSRTCVQPNEVVVVGAQETVGPCLSLVSEELAQAMQQSHERPPLEHVDAWVKIQR